VLIRSLATRLVPPLAAGKLALGLVAFFATYSLAAGGDPYYPYVLYGILPIAFGATAGLLLLGGRNDRRAVALGGFFLVTATAWGNKPLALFTDGASGANLFSLADALELDGFMAFFLWAFVRDFPSPPVSLSSRRRVELAIRASLAAGFLLLVFNLVWFAAKHGPGGPGAWENLARFAPKRGQGIYYTVVLSLTGMAFAFLLWRARAVQRIEQRRARIFLQVLALTFGPMILEVLLELFGPGYSDFLRSHPQARRNIVTSALLPALTLPFTVPYAVLFHRVLDVRLIARGALQYALARYTALTLMVVPTAALGIYLFVHRGQSIGQLFSGGRVLLLVSAAGVGATAFRYRRALLDAIDRRFFREQYDARNILSLLVDRIRAIQDSASLAHLLTREIDLALHLHRISMLVLDPRSGMLCDPRSRSRKLDASSPLALIISNASGPLSIDLDNPHSPLQRLQETERQWLLESGFRLMVPILARDGSLLGLLGLGEKKSGLPFLREDRQLLRAIASSAAWVLELEQTRSLASSQPSSQDPLEIEDATPSELPASTVEPARECPKCGALHPAYTVFCRRCSRRLETSRVPYVLPGKFRLEQRIGAGGMGVVYSGVDLALGRHVAIKTLRRISPDDVLRLRREARTAAAVSHPHLAPIFGMETWEGTPMLVLELLEGGTLAQRINGKGLGPGETVELGIAMAGALAQLHAADILHRDIKPSNVGYTRDRVPKLMDFGIARVVFELRQEEDLEALDREIPDDSTVVPPVAVWATREETGLPLRHRFVGTLSYLSPEALQGKPADVSFDLWSLTVVLYECLLGRKIFSGTDQQVVERIRSGRVPDFSQVCPEHPPALGEFFREALHRSPSRRPTTADELRRRLERVREELP
jgi:protein kinase-like protein/GAF domain-containing protein